MRAVSGPAEEPIYIVPWSCCKPPCVEWLLRDALWSCGAMRQRKEAARPAAVAHEEQAAKDSAEREAQRSRKAEEVMLAACGVSLLSVRLASSALNTVHDCDEVFNYWEPLHFLLHGSGLQTWENRRAAGSRQRRPSL